MEGKMAACLENGLGGGSLTDPEVRETVKVGGLSPRKANVVHAATSDRYTVDVYADEEAAVTAAAAGSRRTRRAEPDGDGMPAIVGQLATVIVRRRGRLEDFDVWTTMSASVEDSQPQFVTPPTNFNVQQPGHR